MHYILYALIAVASLVMVYFGYQRGDSAFYMSIFSAAIILWCIYTDYKNRKDKKEAEEAKKTTKGTVLTHSKKANDRTDISKYAHKSTKNKGPK